MPDYRFTLTKQTDIVLSADNEDSAWTEIAKINPDLLGAEWNISLNSTIKKEVPLDQGPVEIDDFDSDWDLGRMLGA